MFGCIKNAEISSLTISEPTFVQISATTSLNLSPLVGVAISEDGMNAISDCHIIGDPKKTIVLSDSERKPSLNAEGGNSERVIYK